MWRAIQAVARILSQNEKVIGEQDEEIFANTARLTGWSPQGFGQLTKAGLRQAREAQQDGCSGSRDQWVRRNPYF